MKKVLLTLTMLLFAFTGVMRASAEQGNVRADQVIEQGFEDGLGDWTMNHCHSSSGVTSSYGGNTGNYAFRFYYTTNYPQYLISPELDDNDGVNFTFYAARYSSSYPETFKVGYSSTTNDPTEFTWGSEVTCTTMYGAGAYQEYSYDFPAGTKYVSIACTSNDQFYLFVDDITVTLTAPAAGGTTVEVTIGDPTSTTTDSYLPGYSLYEYAISQQIYTADEIGVAGTINTLTMWLKNSSSYARNINVYMKEVAATEFASNSAWESFTASDMVASFTMPNGNATPIEVALPLDNPFVYSGTNNLAICFQDVTGQWSSGLGGVVMNAAGNQAIYAYRDGTVYDPSNVGVNGTLLTKKNVIKLAIMTSGSGLADGWHINPDPIDLGDRPIGVWSEPMTVNLQYGGGTVTVNGFEVDNEFFSINAEVPFTLGEDPVEIEIGVNTEATVTEGDQDGNMVILYTADDRSAIIFPISAFAYAPASGDVFEDPVLVTSFPYSEMTPAGIRHNYTLEGGDPDAFDAVYKMTFANDVLFSASNSGADPVVFLYNEDFDGQDGPGVDNYYEYNGPEVGPDPFNVWFDPYAFTGSNTFYGSSTMGMYFGYKIPASLIEEYELANASIVTVEAAAHDAYPYNLYIYRGGENPSAGELVGYQPMAGNPQEFYFFSLNVNNPVLCGTDDLWVIFYSDSPYTAYCGKDPVDTENGKIWYTFPGYTSWYTSTSYTPMIYVHFVEIPTGREVVMNLADMSIESKGPAKEFEMSEAEVFGDIKRVGKVTPEMPIRGNRATSYTDMFVPAGTYYAVFASTDDAFDVEMSIDEVPAPYQAYVYSPYDTQTDITNFWLAQWYLGDYTTEMQVILDATYPPTHVYMDWTDQLVNSCFLTGLDNNKTYFMQVNARNEAGTTYGDIIGFTTVIDPVEGFAAESTELYPGDAAVFTWTANDRNLRGYNLYQDGVLVNVEGPISGTTYSVEGLTYNMTGYDFNLTALYDEGESVFSNTVRVKMTGTGTVNGHVWEIDSITPVYNVAIQFRGHDEYGHEQVIDLAEHTNPSGYYEGEVLAGTFTAYGIKDGYVESPSEAITLAYGATVDDNEIYMLEDPLPLGMIKATLQEEENNVLVEWSWDPASLIVDFETGDFSQAEFTLPASYPWAISTTNPHEGTYCIKSTCEGVASAISSIEATVDVPYDGKMGFYVKVSSESNYDKFHFYIDGVEQGQALSGVVNWTQKEFAVTEGTHTYKWEYAKDSSVNSNDDCVYVDDITMYRLDVPVPPTPGAQFYDFDDSSMQGWTAIDGGSILGYGWQVASSVMSTGYGHNASTDCMLSQSYSNTAGPITPNNYLIAPTQISAHSGAGITFYACAQDAAYAAEHFGVAVSTTGNAAADFTTIQEWTMTAKGAQGRTAESEFDIRGTRAQGTWYEYTVDLSSYAGQNIWVAIRHFNCNDMFYLLVDDITLSDGSAKREGEQNRTLQGYNLYRANINGTVGDTLEIAHPAIDVMSYIDNEWASLPYGIYKWGIQARYEGNHHYAEKGNRDLIFIGEGGTTTSNYLPTYNLYNYSLTQQIYTADEIGTAGVINAITFLPQGSITRTLDVYMVNTDKAAFAGSTDWITVTNDDKVFSGSVSMAAPETTITLDSPFTYNGTDNLAIIVNDLTGTWTSSIYYATFAATGQAIRIYQDSAPYNPLAPTSYSGSVMNEKNQIKIDITPGGGSSAAGANNSEILWSNEIEKDMEAQIVFHIALNNDQDPAGATVTMVCGENTYEGTFETDTLAFENVRKGTYQVTAELEGYETVTTELLIEADADYDIFLEEILEVVENLYVSPTGWAIWDTSTATNGPTAGSGSSIGGHTGGGGGGGGGTTGATTFSEDFEGGLNGWNVLTINAGEGEWIHSDNNLGGYDYTTHAHSGTGFAMCYSFVDYVGAFNTDSYMYTPQKYDIVAGSTLNFWADNANDSYPENFSVCVSTVDNPTSASDFTQVWSGSAKGTGNGENVRHMANRYDNWRSHSIDLSAYAGQSVYIAFHDVNYDMYEVWIDDVELTAGSKGDRYAVMYKVKLDGVYEGETPNMFWQHNEDNLTEGTTYTTSVAPVYATGMGEWVDYTWTYQDCSNFVGATDVTATEDLTNYAVNVSWTMPEGGVTPPPSGNASTFSDGFESGLPEGWTVVDGNNDGWTWCLTSAIPTTWTYYASLTLDWYRTGTNAICSGSYINGVGALTPNEYLVSPQLTLAAGSTFSFWAAATDASYPADHFGVFVSDDATNWTSVQEWTLTGKSNGNGGRASRDGNGAKLGTWYNYTVDLSDYAGEKYIAIRHFNCNDQYIMVVDDMELTAGSKGNRDMWDLVTTFTGTSAGQQAVATDGNFIYTASWQSTPTGGYTFYKYDLDGTFVEGFEIAGATGIRDLTYDGEYFYGSSGATQIFCMDFTNKTLVSTINCSGLTSRHLTYDPERDGFWSGNWSTLALYDRSGNLVQNGPAPSSAYGSAYYKDADGVEHLYLFCQPNSDCKVYDYNIATNTISSSVVYDYTNNVPGCTGIAGGCFIGTYDSKTCWFGNSQQDPNLIAIVELDANAGPTPPPTPVEGIMGSLLLRDGEIIAMFIGDEAGTNSYVDTEVGDGEHEYCVRVIYGGDPDVTLWAMSCPECATVNYTGVVENDVVDNIYPNPTHDVVTIEAQGMNHITVVNTLGQVVYDADVDADMIQLNLGQYKSGLYLVRVNTESGVSVKRVTLVK